MELGFVLNDERVTNSHGFRLINEGGDFARFNTNPVMLHNHDDKVVIGRWKDLKIEAGKLIAVPEFDTDDEQAKKLQGKVERGFLKGASPLIYIDRLDLLKDESGEYLAATKWELFEASICSIPSNAGSLRLCSRDGVLLDEGLIKLKLEEFKLKKMEPQKEAAPENVELAKLQEELKAAKEKITQLEADKQKENDARAVKLVSDALAAGRFNASLKDDFLKMAKDNYAMAEKVIGGMPARQRLSEKVKAPSAPNPNEDKECYDWLQKYNPAKLAAIREEEPDRYTELAKEYAAGVRYRN